MGNVNTTVMAEEEERDLKYEKFMEYIRAHITVVDKLPFDFADDDPFLVKKLDDAQRVLEEAPLPEWLVKRMNEKK